MHDKERDANRESSSDLDLSLHRLAPSSVDVVVDDDFVPLV